MTRGVALTLALSTVCLCACRSSAHVYAESYGVRCAGDAGLGPLTYRVADIGKPGVPRPSAADMAMIKKISAYVKSKSIRFTYVAVSGERVAGAMHVVKGLIVYDATLGPCTSSVPYTVLNASCNAIYESVERPNELSAAPGPCTNTPYPWMPPKVPNNSH